MEKRPKEPFLWALFSSGGMLAALVLPAVVALLWLALPLGWAAPPSHAALAARLDHPLARLFVFVLVCLAMFHWAHRFRYTLYDGLQLYHLSTLIAAICYGGATAVSLVALYLIWFA